MMNVTDYDLMTDVYICTINENNNDVFKPALLFTIPCGLTILCLMSLLVYTLIKPLFKNKQMEKFLYPNCPVRCIITGPSECVRTVFLTIFFK